MPLRASRKARDKVAKVTSRVRAQKKAKISQAKEKTAKVTSGSKEMKILEMKPG